jgi:CelD/BcsL family acetyltransferase involved in cellulose biosynthesis
MILQALPDPLPRPDAMPAPDLSVRVHERLDTVADAWRRLEGETHVSLHQGFDWCKAWLCTHPAPVLIVEGLRGSETVFILPLEIVSRQGVRTARFIASPFSNINTGLFAAELGVLDPERLQSALRAALAGRTDLLSLTNMPLHWRGRLHPFSALDPFANQNHAFQMPLFPSFEDTLRQVNAKRRRKKFRVQQRRLEEIGGYEIHSPHTTTEQHALLEEFFRQKAERFRAHGLPDVFREKAVQDFFHALLDAPGTEEDYPLRLHGLRLKGENDGVVLAVAGLSRKGDHVICQFGSIRDDLFPETSPGEFLFWHLIEQACATGAALFDFGIGDQAYKRSWCTVETVQYDVLLPVSAKGRVAAAAHRGTVRLKAAIKQNRRLYALIQRMRSGPAKPAAEPAENSD